MTRLRLCGTRVKNVWPHTAVGVHTNEILQNISNVDQVALKNDLNSLHWGITKFKLLDN